MWGDVREAWTQWTLAGAVDQLCFLPLEMGVVIFMVTAGHRRLPIYFIPGDPRMMNHYHMSSLVPPPIPHCDSTLGFSLLLVYQISGKLSLLYTILTPNVQPTLNPIVAEHSCKLHNRIKLLEQFLYCHGHWFTPKPRFSIFQIPNPRKTEWSNKECKY